MIDGSEMSAKWIVKRKFGGAVGGKGRGEGKGKGQREGKGEGDGKWEG